VAECICAAVDNGVGPQHEPYCPLSASSCPECGGWGHVSTSGASPEDPNPSHITECNACDGSGVRPGLKWDGADTGARAREETD